MLNQHYFFMTTIYLMTIYNEQTIAKMYWANQESAIQKLMQVRIFCGTEPRISGLNGWVYEQTIQYCLKKDLKQIDLKFQITEQVKLNTRVKADLRIGDVAIEIKLSGLFTSADIDKYGQYKQVANLTGLSYLFITGVEGYRPYRDGITKALGKENTFFLDSPGEWRRFISRLATLLNQKTPGKRME